MIKNHNLIVIIEFPLNKRDYNRFGIRFLSEKFNLIILDLSLLNNKIYKDKNYVAYNPTNIQYFKINKISELLIILKKLGNSKCIDFLNDLFKNKIIRIIMGFYNIKLIRTSHGALSVYYNPKTKRFKDLIKNIIYNYNDYYIHSISCLKADSRSSKYKHYSHTFDYDLFIKNKPIGIQSDKSSQKTVVFVDQCLADNPDFKFLNSSTVNQSSYYNDIKIFLNNIHFNGMKVKINIALHPKTSEKISKKYFNNFNCFQNQTEKLITDCDIVIHHHSAAIGFAYLYNKPILTIYTNEMMSHKFFKVFFLPYIKKKITLSQMYIINKPININNITDLNLFNYDKLDKKIYNSYINNFIKHPLSTNLNSWQSLYEFMNKKKI